MLEILGLDHPSVNRLHPIEKEKRCLVLLSNDVRAERIYPEIAQMVLGDTKMPWLWEYKYKWTQDLHH